MNNLFMLRTEKAALGLVTEQATGFRYIGVSPNRERIISPASGMFLTERNCTFTPLYMMEFTREFPVRDTATGEFYETGEASSWDEVNLRGNYLVPKE